MLVFTSGKQLTVRQCMESEQNCKMCLMERLVFNVFCCANLPLLEMKFWTTERMPLELFCKGSVFALFY